jgi:general secretion pathway protein B
MSFILDALRKSERERQSNQTPGVAQLWIQGKRGNRAFWLPLVMLLVGLNFSLLLFLWLKGDPDTAEDITATDTSTSVDTFQPVTPTQRPATPNEPLANRRLTAEMPADDPIPVIPGNPATPVSAPVNRPATDNYVAPHSNLPTLMELSLAGTINLKPLHLDIHVYSEEPTERFIFINMAKYREGDTLREGPRVDAITKEGVVLDYQGRSFILTRE